MGLSSMPRESPDPVSQGRDLATQERRLVRLLEQAGPARIWRPVLHPDGRILAPGHEDMRDGSPDVLAGIDFQDRSVLDLGCNFGYYCFLAKKLGAGHVVGVDVDPLAIQGCLLQQQLWQYRDMRFLLSEFSELALSESFDIVLLINFIGKRSLGKNIGPLLDMVAGYAGRCIILTARPKYHIRRNLCCSPEQIEHLYGSEHIQGEWFFLNSYLAAFFSPCWHMEQLSPDYPDQTIKRTYRFTKQTPNSANSGDTIHNSPKST